MGAVMGSKNLKAIAVRGKKQVPMADAKKIRDVAMWVRDTMDENHYNFHHYGTGAAMVGKHLEGHLPVRNWQLGTMDTVELIDAKTLKAEFGEKMDGCYACSVRCKKRVRVDATLTGGVDVEPKYGGAEYETLGRDRHQPRRRQPGRALQGEPGAQLVGPRQRLDRRDDRLGDGVLPARHPHQGRHRRPGAGVGRRRAPEHS